MNAFRPDLVDNGDFDGLGMTLGIVWLIMAIYGVLFLYGLFIKPKHLKKLLNIFASWKIFGKSRERIRKAADDIEATALGISQKPLSFHAHAAWMTLAQWICRFFSITAILIAFSPDLKAYFMDHIILLSRGASLYAVTAYSPTPGGSGVAELIFGSFYSDYIVENVAVLGAIFWRAITYYPYLFIGIIIIPNWIRTIINRRRLNKA
ncbi:MAG: lysylphosphatidylglycerol synthase transmembrane domain-containing protein, partial [Saprospiraceae bacterium]